MKLLMLCSGGSKGEKSDQTLAPSNKEINVRYWEAYEIAPQSNVWICHWCFLPVAALEASLRDSSYSVIVLYFGPLSLLSDPSIDKAISCSALFSFGCGMHFLAVAVNCRSTLILRIPNFCTSLDCFGFFFA